jgi:Na+-transporting methylmalonyl-CoA/oxaloacetate decarboxylase gamma subunit
MEAKTTWFQRHKGITVFFSFLIIIIIVLFAWSQVERRNFNKRVDQQRTELINNSRKIIDENRKNLLHDLIRALSWAVRSEAIRNNYDQANQYLNEFVRRREFELALFADNDGNIIFSTDKRLEQTLLMDHYPVGRSPDQQVNIQLSADNKWMASAPVMGLNARMGTLFLIYDPQYISDEDFLITSP